MREQWARFIAILTGILVLLLAIEFAFIQNPEPAPDAPENRRSMQTPVHVGPLALDADDIEIGRQIYRQQSCARCHSIAGEGNPRNPLDGVGAKHSAAELYDWIVGADKLAGVIPERAYKLKQAYRELPVDALDALVNYLLSLRPHPDKPIPQSTKKIPEGPDK